MLVEYFANEAPNGRRPAPCAFRGVPASAEFGGKKHQIPNPPACPACPDVFGQGVLCMVGAGISKVRANARTACPRISKLLNNIKELIHHQNPLHLHRSIADKVEHLLVSPAL